MTLSIIITHHKTPELLYLCIKSIKENIKNIGPVPTRGGSTRDEYEIIVVDGQAQKQTKELIQEKWPDIKFVSFKKNVGYSKMVNRGIKQTKGNYILILNADIIVLENSVNTLIKQIQKDEKIGITAPQSIDFTNKVQVSCFNNPSIKAILARRTSLGKTKWGREQKKEFEIDVKKIKEPKEVDWVQGSAMMVRKKAIEMVGLLDERFFMYFEDADWCRRFWGQGFKIIYVPQAKMAHYYHRASKKFGFVFDLIFNKYTRTHILSAIKYFSKYA